MSHLRFRKSPNIRVELLSVISKHKELPMELEHMILDKYTPQLSERTKGDIRKLAKRYSVRMRFRKVQEKYIAAFKRVSDQTFECLPEKYRKAFVLALEKDIDDPSPFLFIWLHNHWCEIVRYIGNRTPAHNIQHFLDFTYGQTYHVDCPRKVCFRRIVNDVNFYTSYMYLHN